MSERQGEKGVTKRPLAVGAAASAEKVFAPPGGGGHKTLSALWVHCRLVRVPSKMGRRSGDVHEDRLEGPSKRDSPEGPSRGTAERDRLEGSVQRPRLDGV